MEIKELNNDNLKDFYKVDKDLYKDDPNWVCPISQVVEGLFHESTNHLMKDGANCRWILYHNNKPIGRIAAFWTDLKSKRSDIHSGGIGFFECINSQEAANILFKTAITWLKNEGMHVVDASIVPGDNYNFWGILIDGFEPQAHGMPYNPSYYKELFENYGFQIYFEQNSYHVDLTKEFPQRHIEYAQKIIDSNEYSYKHTENKNLEPYIQNVTDVYNDVWSSFHADWKPVKVEYFEKVIRKLKPISNEKFIWFAYKNEKPIGMAIALPDLNQIIKPFKGKLNLLNKLKLGLKIKKVSRARLMVYGVHPDYHNKGVAAALFKKVTDAMKEEGIKELEMSWVGDYNPRVNKIYKHLGNSHHAKTHATFRFMIDENLEFKRFTNEKEI